MKPKLDVKLLPEGASWPRPLTITDWQKAKRQDFAKGFSRLHVYSDYKWYLRATTTRGREK